MADTFFERALRRVTPGALARSYLAKFLVALVVDEVEAGDVEGGGADHDPVGDADGGSASDEPDGSGAVEQDETAFTFDTDEDSADASAGNTTGGTAADAAESSDSDGSEKPEQPLDGRTDRTEE